MATVEEGNTVKIHYTGKLEDGSVFDSSEGKEPLTFKVGEGKIIKGFDEGVRGMSVGDEKDLVITPADGYGERREELKQEMPKEQLQGVEAKVGLVIGMQVPGHDQVFPATIAKVTDTTVTVDINPPLAGKTLHFHVKLEAIE